MLAWVSAAFSHSHFVALLHAQLATFDDVAGPRSSLAALADGVALSEILHQMYVARVGRMVVL